MAKTSAGLLSMGATGTIGKTMTFATWKGVPYVRRRIVPTNPKSGAQTGVRAAMSWGSKQWASMDPVDQATWNDFVAGKPLSGFNHFIKLGQSNIANLQTYQLDFPAVPVTPGVSPTLGAAAASGRKLLLTWTDGVSADIWNVHIYRSDTTGFTPSPTNLVAIVSQGVETYLDSVPGPGTWFYRIASGMTDGTLVAAATEFSGTSV